jgi:hypothetical protein
MGGTKSHEKPRKVISEPVENAEKNTLLPVPELDLASGKHRIATTPNGLCPLSLCDLNSSYSVFVINESVFSSIVDLNCRHESGVASLESEQSCAQY